MGKSLIAQRRGKGTSTFRSPSFRYAGVSKHKSLTLEPCTGTVLELLHSQGHSAPLARVRYSDGEEVLCCAPLGIRVGETVEMGPTVELKTGNTLPLSSIPEGTLVFNVEALPGDGGKFARTSGAAARVAAKMGSTVIIELPSKKQRSFNDTCRATIGVIAGGGRIEKPLVKAGHHYHKMRARNRRYPVVCALSMNAVDHPYGGSRSSKKGKVTIAPRNAPPGRKVGKIRPRRTGRRTR